MSKPLRIGLINQGGRGWIGGSLYIKNIILALSHLPDNVKSTFEVCLLDDGTLDAASQNQLAPYLSCYYNLKYKVKPLTFKNRLIWRAKQELFKIANPRILPLVKSECIDFLYPNFVSNKETFPARSCPWITDFQHKHMPQLFSKSEIKYRDKAFAAIADNGSKVVVSSKTAEADFKRFFSQSITKVEVLHFRTSPPPTWYLSNSSDIQHKYNLSDKFFLLSNQFWQHKNHLVVMEALKLLQAEKIYPIVVCTGHIYDYRKPDYSDRILQTIHTYKLSKQFLLLGLIPRSDQIQLMRRSIAVIQPSLFEGWSTVVEDARCCAKKMILSDLPVHLEQDPPGCTFFQRNNPEDLANVMANCWQTLTPGPDLSQEKLARDRNIEEVQSFGYRFLEIAQGN